MGGKCDRISIYVILYSGFESQHEVEKSVPAKAALCYLMITQMWLLERLEGPCTPITLCEFS